MDIRLYTGIIIKKGNEYLVGYNRFLNTLSCSTSPWDAWRTRRKDLAYIVAHKVGGTGYLFNPVAKQVREMQLEGERQ